MLSGVFVCENIENKVAEFIEGKYEFRTIACFVEEKFSGWLRKLESKLKTIKIQVNPQKVEEHIALIICVGEGEFQRELLTKMQEKNIELDILFVQLCLDGMEYITNFTFQNNEVVNQNFTTYVFFDESEISESDFSKNLGVYSYLISRYTFLFEKEFYALVFNKNAELRVKTQIKDILKKLDNMLKSKLENIKQANLLLLDCWLEFLNLYREHTLLQEISSVEILSAELSNNLFPNYYDNFFIASVFLTSLYEKYFKLSFSDRYCCDYYKKANILPEHWSEKINRFKDNAVTNETCYKIKINKINFVTTVAYLQKKHIALKYNYLCIFSDFGYNLCEKLQKCDIKNAIIISAEKSDLTLLSQIRNFGLLDC